MPSPRARTALILAALATAACGPQGDRFVTANARSHVNMLAETIGSRPAGSDANRRAREYLIDQLEIAGMQVRVQDHGRDIERGWGKRNTVLRDFLQDDHVFLGQVRVGPDLAGIGTRAYATRE